MSTPTGELWAEPSVFMPPSPIEPPPPSESYSELLKDPRWVAKSDEIKKIANHRCEDAGCDTEHPRLSTHHCYYIYGRKPWEYERDLLICLCDQCHQRRQLIEKTIHVQLAKCLRNVPIRRLEIAAWRFIAEGLACQPEEML
jgi:hypothetical protein